MSTKDEELKALFSSKTDDWETPQQFFDVLNQIFKFETDVCATELNSKCDNYFSKEVDGLTQDWNGVCWMNPPYGRAIGSWVQKAYESSVFNNATIVCLLPARVDTSWWNNYCVKGNVFFLRGRLKFGNSKKYAPFPSAVVIFRPCAKEAIKAWNRRDNERKG